MAIIRVAKRPDYTNIRNAPFDDHSLSFKALGLLCFMLRQPDDWSFSLSWLATKHKDGIDAVRSALNELENAGYVTRERCRSEDGTFDGVAYWVYNESINPIRENPTRDNPTRDNPTLDNPTLDNPMKKNPTLKNPTQLNTKKPNTNIGREQSRKRVKVKNEYHRL